ncbi:MAG: hypothetical protein ACOYNS_09725 [Bacteroidota bacterium]
MRTFLFSALLIFTVIVSASAQILPKNFWKTLQDNSMEFVMPELYLQAPVLPNSDVAYDFAVVSKDRQIEIRYTIQPIDRKVKNGNGLSEGMLQAMALNISGGTMAELNAFPAESVKHEFRADKGYTAMVPVRSEFGNGYNMCMITMIHKENAADAYTFYLFNDPQILVKAIKNYAIFHALKFK